MRDLLARKPVLRKVHSFGSTNVTTSAWVEIIASMTKPASAVEIYNGSGRILELSKGDLGEETGNEIEYYIIPGGSSILLPIEFANGDRISAKAVSANATADYLILNFFA